MERLARAKRNKAGCLIWQGPPQPNGYGCLKVDGKKRDAHRYAWEVAYGEIPSGMCVCHTCDVRLCVEPTHLFLGTKGDNNRDMAAKGRARTIHKGQTHCKRGHEFTSENTRIEMRVYKGTKMPGRHCKDCHREYNREWMKKKRSTSGA